VAAPTTAAGTSTGSASRRADEVARRARPTARTDERPDDDGQDVPEGAEVARHGGLRGQQERVVAAVAPAGRVEEGVAEKGAADPDRDGRDVGHPDAEPHAPGQVVGAERRDHQVQDRRQQQRLEHGPDAADHDRPTLPPDEVVRHPSDPRQRGGHPDRQPLLPEEPGEHPGDREREPGGRVGERRRRGRAGVGRGGQRGAGYQQQRQRHRREPGEDDRPRGQPTQPRPGDNGHGTSCRATRTETGSATGGTVDGHSMTPHDARGSPESCAAPSP
jgi:hypothetical protein